MTNDEFTKNAIKVVAQGQSSLGAVGLLPKIFVTLERLTIAKWEHGPASQDKSGGVSSDERHA